MKNLTYLFAGYMVIWALIAFYMFSLNGKIKNLKQRLDRVSED
jgi:CcmD family protein